MKYIKPLFVLSFVVFHFIIFDHHHGATIITLYLYQHPIYLSKGDIEVPQGRIHPLAEFHHSEMMLQARRYFDGNESLALYVVVLSLFMLIRLVQAATSRVGKMLGNIMDSGAMKVVSTPAYITLFFVLILTGSVTITVPPGCPYCVFNCVCPDQHPQLHLLPQQRDQDRGI